MQYISLSNSALTYFTAKGKISELGGSSMYQVIDTELITKPKSIPTGLERTTAFRDIAQQILNDRITLGAVERARESYNSQLLCCKTHKYTSECENDRLELLKSLLDMYERRGVHGAALRKVVSEDIRESQCKYKFRTVHKSQLYKLNKTKVRAKIWALFNVRQSKSFMAFYSVSFPAGNNADSVFVCWNNWLTYLRKNFNFNNYIWVSELQKNGTIHYHMFTNFRLPILQVNRAMGIVINNQVKAGNMKWGSSSLEKYNGVDVDSVFASKRHKNTGRTFNPVQLRDWLSKYITKYVSKNNATFTNLAWHCSRSVSQLFTSTVYELSESQIVTSVIPPLYLNEFENPAHEKQLYQKIITDYCTIFIFLFVPPPLLYDKVQCYNNYIFAKHVIQHKINNNLINYKSQKL